MMSGGDLDGDQFFVTWDRKLLTREDISIQQPANYDNNDALVEKPSEY
jgi:hypothetical protein